MNVYSSVESVPPSLQGPVVTLGNFDGVHRGHRFILEKTTEHARKRGRPVLLVTFLPHPLKVLRPDAPPRLLSSHEEKMKRIQELGIEHALVIPFTIDFAEISAEEFVRRILHRRLNAGAVFVGNNFNFGRGREGNVDLLRSLGRELGFEVPDLPDFLILGSPVSSSRIRRAILSGEVELARELLGRPFSVSGTVAHGDARGASLGYPTANLRTASEILPGDGVYVTKAALLGKDHPSVTNVGSRPTFDGASFAVETHFLDPPGNLYDREMTVSFLARLRPEVRFSSKEHLTRQIAADVERARRYFKGAESEP